MPTVTVQMVRSIEALKKIADDYGSIICHYQRAEGEDVFFITEKNVLYRYVSQPNQRTRLHHDNDATVAKYPTLNMKPALVKPESPVVAGEQLVAEMGDTRGRADRLTRRLPRRFAELGGAFLLVSGVILLAGVGWLTWHDVMIWGKDVSGILLGSRVDEPMSLGIDVKGIHYLLAGASLLTLGLIASLGPIRRLVSKLAS